MSDEHWQQVYSSKVADEVSWFQRDPEVSLALIHQFSLTQDAVIDVGAGQSLLVDELLNDGYSDVTVLDISQIAIDAVRVRLGAIGEKISYVVTDVRHWASNKKYSVWHDRAVFHFMTSVDDVDAYVSAVSESVRCGGVAIIGTFAEDGPTQCSGLDVSRYSVPQLAETFSASFELVASESEVHVTPWGSAQHFNWVVLKHR